MPAQAKKRTAKPRKIVKPKAQEKKKPRLECAVCGYRVVVDEACGCAEEHEATENMEFREKLAADIGLGMQHGVQATPSYLIDGKVYPGAIPPEVFRGIVD